MMRRVTTLDFYLRRMVSIRYRRCPRWGCTPGFQVGSPSHRQTLRKSAWGSVFVGRPAAPTLPRTPFRANVRVADLSDTIQQFGNVFLGVAKLSVISNPPYAIDD